MTLEQFKERINLANRNRECIIILGELEPCPEIKSFCRANKLTIYIKLKSYIVELFGNIKRDYNENN